MGMLFLNELVLFAELSLIFLQPLQIYWLMHCFFHTLIIAVLFGPTAFLNYVILSKFFKINLLVFFCLLISEHPFSDMMNTLFWNKLNDRWNEQLLVIVFKCLQHNAPSYLSLQFTFTCSIHTQCTRSQSCKHDCVLPSWNNNQGKRTFYYRGASMWNKLSSDVRSNLSSVSLNMLKSNISV